MAWAFFFSKPEAVKIRVCMVWQHAIFKLRVARDEWVGESMWCHFWLRVFSVVTWLHLIPDLVVYEESSLAVAQHAKPLESLVSLPVPQFCSWRVLIWNPGSDGIWHQFSPHAMGRIWAWFCYWSTIPAAGLAGGYPWVRCTTPSQARPEHFATGLTHG